MIEGWWSDDNIIDEHDDDDDKYDDDVLINGIINLFIHSFIHLERIYEWNLRSYRPT